ncbi:MAG: lactate utilization protein [Spirochaetes bacterium]|uniref:Lactate utilization protein n=1 Tax=Candidatus Ornithospirochaeta stercoripullorum TaxID=2840899 RepID=A0A9D9DYC9_9SPIO|nr:lactate utilization protein [Candidatus Ornithospirochaeta stercoripullorum]
MDANQRKALQGTIKQTLENLEANGFKATYVNDKEELLSLIKSLVPEGSVTATGGSETLQETGIMDYLKKDTAYNPDRKNAYTAQYYLASANAITMHGEIYEVDGRGNRVSAMLFGPENVIVVAGINKLVTDIHAAVERVKTKAAPPNCIRLGKDTPCVKLGHCTSQYFDPHHMGAIGCASDDRICSNFVVFSRQTVKDRITVILVGEEYGY